MIFADFISVAVNIVYKLQFFYIYCGQNVCLFVSLSTDISQKPLLQTPQNFLCAC